MTTTPTEPEGWEAALNELIDSLDLFIRRSDAWVILSMDEARLCRSLAAERLGAAAIPSPAPEPAGRPEQPEGTAGRSVSTPQGEAGAAVSLPTSPAPEWDRTAIREAMEYATRPAPDPEREALIAEAKAWKVSGYAPTDYEDGLITRLVAALEEGR